MAAWVHEADLRNDRGGHLKLPDQISICGGCCEKGCTGRPGAGRIVRRALGHLGTGDLGRESVRTRDVVPRYLVGFVVGALNRCPKDWG